MTLNPKITYLRQQLTSLVSLRYFRTAGMAERHLDLLIVRTPSHTCRIHRHQHRTEKTEPRGYTRGQSTLGDGRKRGENLRNRREDGKGTHSVIHIQRGNLEAAHHPRADQERGNDMANLKDPFFQLPPLFWIDSFFGTPARACFYLVLSPAVTLSLSISFSLGLDQLITVTHRTAITTAAIVTSRRALLATGSTRLPASRDHRLMLSPSPLLRCTLRVRHPLAISPSLPDILLPLRRSRVCLALPLTDSLVDLFLSFARDSSPTPPFRHPT